MSPTQDRIQHLADACAHDEVAQWTGRISSEDLRAWLVAELGHDGALDEFQPHGPLLSKAVAPRTLLHIVSGNTAHAAFQSIIRGLLIGSHNVVKIPSGGLPDLTGALACFPQALRGMIEIQTSLGEEDWAKADAVIAIGSDQSVEAVHQHLRSDQTFIAHNHKVSVGVVYEDHPMAAKLAARDVSLHNQRGCLSLHAIYTTQDSESFAKLLAIEMEQFSQDHPPESLTTSEAGAVRNLRETTRFCAANDPAVKLLESVDSLDWTVIHDPSPELKLSCLNRCVYVKPLPPVFDSTALGAQSEHLSTIAIHPFHRANALSLQHLPAHRICPLGQSQQPSLFWHHDGFAPLASLVKWKDIG
jgi:hypothetical protein